MFPVKWARHSKEEVHHKNINGLDNTEVCHFPCEMLCEIIQRWATMDDSFSAFLCFTCSCCSLSLLGRSVAYGASQQVYIPVSRQKERKKNKKPRPASALKGSQACLLHSLCMYHWPGSGHVDGHCFKGCWNVSFHCRSLVYPLNRWLT